MRLQPALVWTLAFALQSKENCRKLSSESSRGDKGGARGVLTVLGVRVVVSFFCCGSGGSGF